MHCMVDSARLSEVHIRLFLLLLWTTFEKPACFCANLSLWGQIGSSVCSEEY